MGGDEDSEVTGRPPRAAQAMGRTSDFICGYQGATEGFDGGRDGIWWRLDHEGRKPGATCVADRPAPASGWGHTLGLPHILSHRGPGDLWPLRSTLAPRRPWVHLDVLGDSTGSRGTRFSDARGSTTGLTLCPLDKAALYRTFWRLPGTHNRVCNENMEPLVHGESCVHDLCATGGLQGTLCATLRGHAQECQ